MTASKFAEAQKAFILKQGGKGNKLLGDRVLVLKDQPLFQVIAGHDG